MSGFDRFFTEITGHDELHQWQVELAKSNDCGNRLIRVPTGLGKTLGVLSTWIWHRVNNRNDDWPRRLIWCLPTRVLVEQMESEVKVVLKRLGVLWNDQSDHENKVGVHMLMGGTDAGQWYLYPECDAVLIGTQDMLLSRAMNRGYASPRARWPMEFGLLNQDALWVMDEVQMMDVGLATSAQLQIFRNADSQANKMYRPCFTWWMSATLQRNWLEKSPDATDLMTELRQRTHTIESRKRSGPLWDGRKPCQICTFKNERELAKDVSKRHRAPEHGKNGPTLVVLNTVDRAVNVWEALKKDKALSDTDVRLVHSRFRPQERRAWREDFLNRATCDPGTDRIIVATQVIEAGVDISSSLLITELAPWTSLVQRFGRCARWGGKGQVVVADFEHNSENKAAPYSLDELNVAREACESLPDVASAHLECFEEGHAELLPRLYPYQPKHLLLRHEIDELFDTTPDLSGADIDISRFIRSGTERDLQVFWARIDDRDPPPSLKATRIGLCNVPFIEVRKWLCKPQSETLNSGRRAWVWDWLSGEWRMARRRDLYPGQTVLVESRTGGYCQDKGWDPNATDPVESVADNCVVQYERCPCWKRDGDGWRASERRVQVHQSEDQADDSEDDESLSVINGWQTIAVHGLQVGQKLERLAEQLVPRHAPLLHLAGRWHDLGKAHPAFQGSIQAENRPERDDIAKAPGDAWPCNLTDMYRIDSTDQRRGFRHELASTLGLFGVLQRHKPDHPALLGPWLEWFSAMGEKVTYEATARTEPTAVEREILNLSDEEFDLVAYLVCAHHGKVRMTWHSSPADQKADDTRLRIRGVRENDILPTLLLADSAGEFHQLPATSLDLSPSGAGLNTRTGKSWTDRTLGLLDRFSPFTLAWLESVLRAADQRVSRMPLTDNVLEEDNVRQKLDTSHRPLAQVAGKRTQTPSPGGDSAARYPLHGNGERTSGRESDTGTSRPPHSSTRYVKTRLGILSYQQLAPLLAEKVADVEFNIAERTFSHLPFHDVLLGLHGRICEDLTPEMAGRWRRQDVRVGEHNPPPYWKVPILIHDYTADLETRLSSDKGMPTEHLIEDLVFAEGHLLHIHPFEDFNGRVTRLFLIELMYRLDLPIIDPSASPGEETRRYFSALRAYDRHDTRPLAAIWRRRFGEEV